MAKERGDVLQGTLDMLVLKALQLEPMHGWGITERIEQWSESVLQLGQGTLYPALYRLERQGLIRSEWKVTENNRRARYYSLTRDGRRHFSDELAQWRRMSRAVNLVLEADARVAGGAPMKMDHRELAAARARSAGADALERGLDEEIRFHIDQQTEKNRRAGMSPDEARRQALIRFGGVERVKESTRDEIRPALLEDSLRDVRHGLRVLRRAPGFTAARARDAGARHRRHRGDLQRRAHGDAGAAALPRARSHRRRCGRPIAAAPSRNVIAPANFVAWRERTRTLEHLGMVGTGRPRPDDQRPADRRLRADRLSADVFRRARRAAGARPRLHRRGRLRRQQRGHRAQPRVLAAPPRRARRRARHDAGHQRRPAHRDRRDACRASPSSVRRPTS